MRRRKEGAIGLRGSLKERTGNVSNRWIKASKDVAPSLVSASRNYR